MKILSTTPLSELRLLRSSQVLALVPFSPSRLRQLEAEGKFPKRIALGDNTVAWRETEVRQFLLKRIAKGKLVEQGATKPRATPPAKKARGRA